MLFLKKKKNKVETESDKKGPLARRVSREELIEALDISVIEFRQNDLALWFGAFQDADASLAFSLKEARPYLLSKEKAEALSYNEMAEWIVQHDSECILNEPDRDPSYVEDNPSMILIYLKLVFEALQNQEILPRRTFLIFREYVDYHIEYADGRFFDRKTRKEMDLTEAREKEKDIRLSGIAGNMDRAGHGREQIEEYLASCDVDLYIDEILALDGAGQ